jgi:copper(I)-binding protein
MRAFMAIVSVCVIALSGCGTSSASGELRARDAWIRFAGTSAAAYVTIANKTDDADALTGASVPADVAARTEIHQTTTDDGDMLGMHMSPSIDLPADFELKMNPGGYHFMLTDIRVASAVGTHIPLTLQFEHHAPITVEAEVRR